MTQSSAHFLAAERDTLYRVLYARRDMRHFLPNTHIDEAVLQRLGLGWVSLFDQQQLADLLGCPAGARPIALLCLGPVPEFYPRPMLEELDWRQGKPLSAVLMEDSWCGDQP